MSTETVPKGYKRTEVGVIPEEWNVVQVSKIGEIIRGASPRPKGDKRFYGGDIPRLMVEDVTRDGKFVVPSVDFLTEEGAKRSRPCKKGTLTIVCSGTVGVTSFLGVDACIHDGFLALIGIKSSIASDYLYHKFCSLRENFDNSATHGGVFTNLTTSGVKDLVFSIPATLAEQQAIAAALSDADALIESLEQLLAKKRQIKQGAMQELLTGKRRLPGFSGEWMRVSLGRFGKCIRGVSYNPDQDLAQHDTDKTYRLLRSNNIKGSCVVFENMQYVDGVRVSSQQVLVDGDILICMANGSKDLVGKVGIFSRCDCERYTFGAFMGAFRVQNDESHYVFLLLQSNIFRKHVGVLLAGSSINNLTPASVESCEMMVPTEFEERNAIAAILSDMDSELEALEAKLDKARQVKQGMMQQLLTGKVRLV